MSLTFDGTSGLALTNWTTAGRPTSPTDGQMGFNSTLGYVEWYSSTYSSWTPIYSGPVYNVDYLVVAGGGGGGYAAGGGGGAGGFVTGTSYGVSTGSSYAVTVGSGGAAGTSGTISGTNGSNSIFTTISSTGGGGGGSEHSNYTNAGFGGSGLVVVQYSGTVPFFTGGDRVTNANGVITHYFTALGSASLIPK